MKHPFRTAISMTALLALTHNPATLALDAKPLRAGVAAVDITPREFPINMPGGHNANMAQSAHDPLNARALVLDDGSTTLAMVVIDNLGAGPEVIDEAKAIAAAKAADPASI